MGVFFLNHHLQSLYVSFHGHSLQLEFGSSRFTPPQLILEHSLVLVKSADGLPETLNFFLRI